MRVSRGFPAVFILSVSSALCASLVFGSPAMADDETSIKDLIDFNVPSDTVEASRLSAIHENGVAVGVQGGMIARAKIIIADVQKQSASLDRAFDFSPFVSGDGYLPPVIDKVTDKTEVLNAGQRIEYAGVIYKTVTPARFIRVIPTWRDYLFAGIGDKRLHVDKPSETVRPKNDEEKKVWKEAVEQGWVLGEKQADQIFKENTKKLKKDYIGMSRFIYLKRRGMVESPVVAQTQDRVAVNSDEIDIGTGVREIAKPAVMQKDQGQWGAGR
jgi:hypothetical protein